MSLLKRPSGHHEADASDVPGQSRACAAAVLYHFFLTGSTVTFADFARVDIRVGRIVRAEPFPAARKPAYRLEIDFGPDIGIRKSSAQLTARYRLEELEGRRVLAVVNFPPRQIGPFMSEVLTLGVPDAEGNVVLVVPDQDVPVGGKLF
jgi:tRNA-binding protein